MGKPKSPVMTREITYVGRWLQVSLERDAKLGDHVELLAEGTGGVSLSLADARELHALLDGYIARQAALAEQLGLREACVAYIEAQGLHARDVTGRALAAVLETNDLPNLATAKNIVKALDAAADMAHCGAR